MANQFLKLRRSAVPGRIPSTSSLDFGEIALNTYDGLAFIKKSGSAGEEIVTIGSNLPLFQITTGSVTASVGIGPNDLFLIKSGSTTYFNISSSGNTTINTNKLVVQNLTTQQPVLTISQSVIQFATQSSIPTGTTSAGSIIFTSSSMYIGLE
jgi:hypothetical protein